MAFHQDALGPLGDRAARECALEIVVLGEAAQDDVDRALPVLALGIGDVGEDAAFGRLPEEARIVRADVGLSSSRARGIMFLWRCSRPER